MFRRMVNLPKKNSFFLFGPRGTGKSTLVKQEFSKNARYIDLLLAENEERYALDPDTLYRELVNPKNLKFVVIDEIQKVPRLLDVIHKLIEETDLIFVLTGSSARKLRAGAANLLAGRAFERNLFPLTFEELDNDFNLEEILQWGSLPSIFKFTTDQDKSDYLRSYTNTYLKEEVWNEQFIRKLDPFRKFLQVAAQQNCKILNYSSIARDVGVDSKVVKSYFQLLEDTLLGFFLEPFTKSARKRVTRSPKFYFFDLGICRSLASLLTVPPNPSTSYYGELFEQFIVIEFMRREKYLQRDYKFFFLSTPSNEIDLVIERPGKPLALIEIKSTKKVDENKVSKFASFVQDFPEADFFLLSQDTKTQSFGKIQALHWRDGIFKI